MEVKLKIQIKTKELFNFMIYHTYTSFSGYIGLLLSICAIFGLIATWNWNSINSSYRLVLALTALLFTVIQPITLYLKSKKQAKLNEAINKPLEYVFNEQEIKVSQGEDSVNYSWDEVIKIKSTKLSIFVYVSKYRAFLLPREDFAEGDIAKLKDLLNRKGTSVRSMSFGKIN